MLVGVDLESTARAKGPRMSPKKPLTIENAADKYGIERKQLPPPSARLTTPTKSNRARQQAMDSVRSRKSGGAQSARSPDPGSPNTPKTPGTGGSRSARSASSSRYSPSGHRLSVSGGFTPSPSRLRSSGYSPRVSAHSVTLSPTGRFHPTVDGRRQVRAADMHGDIDYFAPHGAPDNDRKLKEASWITSQAFIESLRSYPTVAYAPAWHERGEPAAYDGNTHGPGGPSVDHVESALRRRLSIAPVDGEWMPDQLPKTWCKPAPSKPPGGSAHAIWPLKRSASAGPMRASRQMSPAVSPSRRAGGRSARTPSPTKSAATSGLFEKVWSGFGGGASEPVPAALSPPSRGLFSR